MLNQNAYPPPTWMVDVEPSTDPERLTIPQSTWTLYQPKLVLKKLTICKLSPVANG